MTHDNAALSSTALAALPLFHGEQPDTLAWLLTVSTVRELASDEVLLSPKQPNHTFYILLSGEVDIRLNAEDTSGHTRLGPGHCIGEMSIIDATLPSATVVTRQPCRLLALDGETLWALINRSHTVARNLLYILAARVRRNNQALEQSLQRQQAWAHSAQNDALTGLYNRRWLDDILASHVIRFALEGRTLALIMLDVDHFKPYNDTYGHLAGDRALRTIAGTIHENIRTTDAAARYGGEEFVILMPDTQDIDAQIIAERLCQAIRNQPISDSDGRALPGITVSIGLARFQPGQSVEQLLAAADKALYRAKHAGRDQVAA